MNNIQNLINEVIDANIKSKKTAIQYQKEYFVEKREMHVKKQNNLSIIQKLNDELFTMLHTKDVLPFTVRGQSHKLSVLSDIKQRYITYLFKVASKKERTIDALNNVQPKIVQLLVDSSLDYDDEEIFFSQASEEIETVFKNNQEDFCSGALYASIGKQINKSINDVSLKEIIHPVLVGYQLPVIKIKPEFGLVRLSLSLPIMLMVRCESIQRSFKYDETNL